jgi:segregation and condensation protein A
MQFQVDISQYSGPLDLLLHIVRRDELDLAHLPLASIIDQYLAYLEVLVELDIDDVAEFLDIASLLIEMKSRRAIPSSEDDDRPLPQPAGGELPEDIVQRLLEYQRIRDAAALLDEQGQRWQLRYSRLANGLHSRPSPDSDQHAIETVEVWDLVSAFSRILRDRQSAPSAQHVYDDTPIHVYMHRIHQLVCQHQRVELTSLFDPTMHKSKMVAMFLATLELTRHYGLSTEQKLPRHPLYLVAGPSFKRELEMAQVDNLDTNQAMAAKLPTMGR